MSEFEVQVVKLGKIGRHPSADTLSITQVKGRYPVILKTGDFAPDDLAVHIPPDAIVDTSRPEFEWLADRAKNGRYRVRFAKIRGVPSYGFLVPLPAGVDWAPGRIVQSEFAIEKYEPGPCYQLGGEIAGDHYSHPAAGVIPQYDVKALRKFEHLFVPGEHVIATEKIHGSNGRWGRVDGELLCGSRTRFRQNSVWNEMAQKYGLNRLPDGIVIYGEVYGPGIQDLTYDVPNDERRVVFFDIYDARTGAWYKPFRFYEFCAQYGLPSAPIVYEGPFDTEELYALAEGTTILGNGVHVREGIVVRPVEERWDADAGRVFLKLVGEGYHLRKGG